MQEVMQQALSCGACQLTLKSSRQTLKLMRYSQWMCLSKSQERADEDFALRCSQTLKLMRYSQGVCLSRSKERADEDLALQQAQDCGTHNPM